MDKQECIERQLESALLEGRWGVFERLPSERGLAEAFGVNRATVRAALRALAGRGILETRRGSGTVVRALPGDARHAAGTFADYLAAFRILMPPLVAASLPAAARSDPDTLPCGQSVRLQAHYAAGRAKRERVALPVPPPPCPLGGAVLK